MDKDKNIPIRTPLKEIKVKFIITTFYFLKWGFVGGGREVCLNNIMLIVKTY